MDFRSILEALARAEVDFIVIGGVCAVLHGVPATTFDLDLVHSREPENLGRLMRVLTDFDACYREHLPQVLRPSEENLGSAGHHLLMTRAGPLDLLGVVAGGRDYASLVERTAWVDLGQNMRVRLLDLETLILLKELVGREKDLAQLPLLRRTLEERERE